ncbi:hypothetical protein ACU4IU_00085 [Brevibacterium sp. CSND-B09]|uniref:hypothetical protein n=1 Tax=Brevibacterium sp. CSND-B09 TaxID=3462571 RepID=UPI00406A6ABD
MTKTISGKTGTTGAVSLAGGASIAPLVVWGLGLAGVDVPPEVAVIIGGLISSLAAILVAWLMPAKSGTYVQVEEPVEEDVYDPAVEAGIEDDPEIPDPSEFDMAEVV